MASEHPPPSAPVADAQAEVAPDPEEDDLSDLDDVLDEFSATKLDTKPKKDATDPKTSDAPKDAALEGEIDEEEFAKQLQAGMAELLGSFGSDPKMQSELESMMKELGGSAPRGDSAVLEGPADSMANKPASASPSKPKKTGDDSFQETIRKTMERMQNSGDSASAAAASSSEEDMLAQMLKAMEKGDFPGLDGGSEEDFNKMLTGMMEQLTNKEILYEPMKDLYEKFPAWLEVNQDTTNADDLARYKEQHSLVTEIVKRFQQPSYSDSNQADRDFIVDRMQKMQAAGSPPPDLVGDMGTAQDMLQDLDGGCPSQ